MLKVVYKNLSELRPYSENARTHSEQQVAAIARSISEFGFTNPILIDDTDRIIAGHGRLAAATLLDLEQVPTIMISALTDEQRRALTLADNRLALDAGWDVSLLAAELSALKDADFDLSLTGFTDEEITALLSPTVLEPQGDPDAVPDVPTFPFSVPGDVWVCGAHRVMCGDSTSITDVDKLMAGAKAHLLHADPPYGMGKQKDGVANDNLYQEDLDKFQMEWWSTFRPFVADNGSAYIWGNAPDLWRLWYVGGLSTSETFELRNQIVWDKKFVRGMKSPDLTKYPIASEHCLFFQFGKQFLGSVNTSDFPEKWEPVRAYMEQQAVAAGIKPGDIKRVCDVGMYSHWFTKSQFTLIPQVQYEKLSAEFTGYFLRPWPELKREWERVRGAAFDSIVGDSRSYFDNAHDIMRDVWEFSRVSGDERHSHATPKPVDMMERVMKSSCPPRGICVEPFGGSGSTLIAAEHTGRACYTMELQPQYVDVIVKRWQMVTGKKAVHADTGSEFGDAETIAQNADAA